MKKIVCLFFALLLVIPVSTYADGLARGANNSFEGYLQKIGGNQVTVEEYDGTMLSFPISEKATLLIDQRLATPADFQPGMEVYGEVAGNTVTLLEGYSAAAPGYIPPGGKMRSGWVTRIDRDQITVQLVTGEQETYFTTPATVAVKKGQNVPVSTLYAGDTVKLYFDQADSALISRMEIMGDAVLVKDLYKGKLSLIDSFARRLTFKDVQVLRNGKWQSLQRSLSLPYDDSQAVFMGGQTIPPQNLRYYQGKDVYLVIKDFFGQDRIEKMVIKNQYESTFSDKITGINWYSETLELANRKNIAFHNGTVVIKSGRLVDKNALFAKADAFVVADGWENQRTADVVWIYNEEINNSNIGQHQVYAGVLSDMGDDRITLADFYLLNVNEWDSFRDSKDLYYDNDTTFFDLENNRQLSAKEVFAGEYAAGKQHWTGYFYTDGDRIVAAVLKKDMDSLLKQRVTTGTIDANGVQQNPAVGFVVTLREAKDWSSKKDQWMPKDSNIKINVEKALIIKDEQRISPEDLRPGDRLYLVRDDFTGKVMIVK